MQKLKDRSFSTHNAHSRDTLAIQQPWNRKLAVSPAVYQTTSSSKPTAAQCKTRSRHSRKCKFTAHTLGECRVPGLRAQWEMAQIYLPGLIQDLWIIHWYIIYISNEMSVALLCSATTTATATATIIFELIRYAKISKCTKSLAPHLLHLCFSSQRMRCVCSEWSELGNYLVFVSLSLSLSLCFRCRRNNNWTKFYEIFILSKSRRARRKDVEHEKPFSLRFNYTLSMCIVSESEHECN